MIYENFQNHVKICAYTTNLLTYLYCKSYENSANRENALWFYSHDEENVNKQ